MRSAAADGRHRAAAAGSDPLMRGAVRYGAVRCGGLHSAGARREGTCRPAASQSVVPRRTDSAIANGASAPALVLVSTHGVLVSTHGVLALLCDADPP